MRKKPLASLGWVLPNPCLCPGSRKEFGSYSPCSSPTDMGLWGVGDFSSRQDSDPERYQASPLGVFVSFGTCRCPDRFLDITLGSRWTASLTPWLQ